MATRIDYVPIIMRRLGAVLAQGNFVAVTAATSSPTDLLYSANDDINGNEIYIMSGTYKGDIRYVKDYATTNGVVTPSSDWTGAPTAGDDFLITSPATATVAQVLDGIQSASRALSNLRFVPAVDQTLRTGDLLMGDGQMERWTDGTAVAPDGFSTTLTGGGAVARSSTYITDGGLYSCALTNGAANAALLTWTFPAPTRWAEVVVGLYADIYTDSALTDRVRLRLTDGVTTWNSSYHTTAGGFEELSIATKTIAAAPTSLVASVRIESGDAITAYTDNMRLLVANGISRYVIPATLFTTISEVQVLDEDNELQSILLPSKWRVDQQLPPQPSASVTGDGTLYIIGSISNDRRLKIIGEKAYSIIDDDTDTIEDATGEYIIAYTIASVLESRAWSTDAEKQQATSARQTANSLLGEIIRPPSPNARRVKT